MDSQLQNLRRQLAAGDTSVQVELEALECRVGNHKYVPITWSGLQWAAVRVCERCLYTMGVKQEELLAPPAIFAYKTAIKGVFHALGGFLNYPTSLCRMHRNYYNSAPPFHGNNFKSCRSAVTCEKCLRIIEIDNPRYYYTLGVTTLTSLSEILAEVSSTYYHYIIANFSKQLDIADLIQN